MVILIKFLCKFHKQTMYVNTVQTIRNHTTCRHILHLTCGLILPNTQFATTKTSLLSDCLTAKSRNRSLLLEEQVRVRRPLEAMKLSSNECSRNILNCRSSKLREEGNKKSLSLFYNIGMGLQSMFGSVVPNLYCMI